MKNNKQQRREHRLGKRKAQQIWRAKQMNQNKSKLRYSDIHDLIHEVTHGRDVSQEEIECHMTENDKKYISYLECRCSEIAQTDGVEQVRVFIMASIMVAEFENIEGAFRSMLIKSGHRDKIDGFIKNLKLYCLDDEAEEMVIFKDIKTLLFHMAGVFGKSLARMNPLLPPVPLMNRHYRACMVPGDGLMCLQYVTSDKPNVVCFMDNESKNNSPIPIPSEEDESILGYKTMKDYTWISVDCNGVQHEVGTSKLLSEYFDELMDYCIVNELFNYDKIQEGI